MPWNTLPPGVWSERATGDGSVLLVEFGNEASIQVLARVVPDAAERRALRTVDARAERVGDAVWAVQTPGDGLRIARTAAGDVLVEVRLADHSGRSHAEVEWLLRCALEGVDLGAILQRAAVEPVPATVERLRPWPLPQGHPLATSHGITQVAGGLSFGVAAVQPPRVTPVGPSDALWAALGPERLLARAVLNLVADAARGDLAVAERSVGSERVVAFGPHPLAPGAVLLPDLALLVQQVLGGEGPWNAMALAPDLLIVAPPHVLVPPDAWVAVPTVVVAEPADRRT